VPATKHSRVGYFQVNATGFTQNTLLCFFAAQKNKADLF
jgi:hypothetical protein